MDGIEDKFEQALLTSYSQRSTTFVYLEIGLARFGTFNAVKSILNELGTEWRMFGIDPEPIGKLSDSSPAVHLFKARRADVRWPEETLIDFALIDGCHCRACATGDFEFVERIIRPGGLVVMHDFGEASEGHIQPTCNGAPSAVRAASKDLKLFADKRPGWKRQPDWIGKPVPVGADCGVFLRCPA